MSKYKIRNAHFTYYEGQTGLCKAKEFVKCNPVNCKLYTIDELSTIVDLQEQLKRKEQECEGLKKNVEHWKMEHKEAKAKGEWTYDLVKKRLGQQLDQLKAEKEKLKKECEIWKNQVLTIDDEAITVQITQQQFEEYDKLKATLTKIKEIVKNMNNECFYSDLDCKDCDMKNGCTYFNKKQILQKISKCEV